MHAHARGSPKPPKCSAPRPLAAGMHPHAPWHSPSWPGIWLLRAARMSPPVGSHAGPPKPRLAPSRILQVACGMHYIGLHASPPLRVSTTLARHEKCYTVC